MRLDRIDSFLAKIDMKGSSECWLWKAAIDYDGYGQFLYNQKVVAVHRFAYELLVGEIPDGLEIDHLCRNRACVNPFHLQPVTHRENMIRGDLSGLAKGTAIHKAKTHCSHGHAYNKENTYIGSDGSRTCRTCARLQAYQKYQKERVIGTH